MKRTAISAILLAISIIEITAQSLWDISKPDNRLSFGINAGINYASMDDEAMSASRFGFNAGFMFDYNIFKSLSLQLQVSYVQKGFDGACGKATMHYVQIPLLVSWRFETQTHVLFHVNVGPYYAYGLGGSIHLEPSTSYPIYYFEQDSFGNRGFFKDYDAGLIVGGAIQLKKLIVGISYELGFMNISEVYDKLHNRNLSINAGFYF